MREAAQFRNLEILLDRYAGIEPLHFFLKNYFRQNRQMGSTDRRLLSGLAYGFFRLGKALPELSRPERIAVSAFLNNTLTSPLPEYIIRTFSSLPLSNPERTLEEKIKIVADLYPRFSLPDLFPFGDHLSGINDKHSFFLSIFRQPLTWIRIRKNKIPEVVAELHHANTRIAAASNDPSQLAFLPGTLLTSLHAYNRGWFEIQDLSSQQTADFFMAGEGESWWDCCCGSGGKSLLLLEQAPSIHLTMSDARPEIIRNARSRINKTGYEHVTIKNFDLLSGKQPFGSEASLDGVILDAPCTGSGTWMRTPERISFFNTEQIIEFAKKQKQMIKAVVPYLKKMKPLVYITCSVFKDENENMIEFAETLGLEAVSAKLIEGYPDRADSLYVIRFIRN